MSASGLSFENPLFSKFVFYAGAVLFKTVFMSIDGSLSYSKAGNFKYFDSCL